MRTAIVLLTLLFPLTGFAAETSQHGSDPRTKHRENGLLKMTQNGLFSVEMVIKEKELKVGVNALDIIVHDKNDKGVVRQPSQ